MDAKKYAITFDGSLNVRYASITTVTFQSPLYEKRGRVSSARLIALARDPLSISARYASITAVTYEDKPYDNRGDLNAARLIALARDPLSLVARYLSVTAVSFERPPYEKRGSVNSGRLVLLVSPPKPGVLAGRLVALIRQIDHGPVIRVPSQNLSAIHGAEYLTPQYTYSDEDTPSVWSAAISESDPIPFPRSITSVSGVVNTVLQSKPISTISHNITSSAYSASLQLTIMPEPRSPNLSKGAFQNYLLSLNEVYEPISMVYSYGVFRLNLQDSPDLVGLPFSDTRALASISSVLSDARQDYEGLPKSPAGSANAYSLALISNTLPYEYGFIESSSSQSSVLLGSDYEWDFGPIHSAFTHSAALQGSVYEWDIGPIESGSVWQVALAQTEQPRPKSYVQSPSVYFQALVQDLSPRPISYVSTSKLTSFVLHGSDYPPPGKMSGGMYPSAYSNIIVAKDEPDAGLIRSRTTVAGANLKWLTKANYLKPSDMIPLTGSANVPSLTINSIIKLDPTDKVISTEGVQQITSLTLVAGEYGSPEDVYESGVFVDSMLGIVAKPSEYPSPGVPVSELFADSVVGIVAEKDDSFPDKSYSESNLIVTNTLGVIADSVEYPQKDGPYSQLQASHVSAQYTVEALYPQKDVPQSIAEVTSLAGVAASVVDDYWDITKAASMLEVSGAVGVSAYAAEYSDKNLVHSSLIATLSAGQVASTSDYPDKDGSYSFALATGVYGFAAITDQSLTGIPDYVPPRRVRVSVTVVY